MEKLLSPENITDFYYTGFNQKTCIFVYIESNYMETDVFVKLCVPSCQVYFLWVLNVWDTVYE